MYIFKIILNFSFIPNVLRSFLELPPSNTSLITKPIFLYILSVIFVLIYCSRRENSPYHI